MTHENTNYNPIKTSCHQVAWKTTFKINGLSIISHVFKRAEKAKIGDVLVATENQEIVDDVKKMVVKQF